MPISEDEYESRSTFEPSTMSKAELRKTHKPIMEKRRRARINHCLNEIKTLILDAMKKDPARHSKLEKADILEMAVKHLQNIQRQQLALAMASDPSILRKFKAGFNECAEEVNRYISGLDGLDAGLQQRITSHLSKCISGIEQIVHLNFPGFGGIPFLSNANNIFCASNANDNAPETSGDQNNNPSIQIPQGVHLIPSRLPTGELALLLPNSSNLTYLSSISASNQKCPTSAQEQSGNFPRPSAFVTVVPSSASSLLSRPKSPSQTSSKPLSPPQSPSFASTPDVHQDEEIQTANQSVRNSPSPRGFRPVNPSQRIHINSTFQSINSSMETRSLVSSAATLLPVPTPSSNDSVIHSEIKSMRFPIQKFVSPQKLVEPLSIITNQAERFKHGQILEETAHCEENLQRGVKRKCEFPQAGLLTVAPSNKILKPYHDSNVADFQSEKEDLNVKYETVQKTSNVYNIKCESELVCTEGNANVEKTDAQTSAQRPSTSSSSSSMSNDMWRPW